MPKKKEKTETIEEKLEYLGLNLDKVPLVLRKFQPLEFRIPKFYDEKQYRQYRYLPIKDIQILLSPTNRLDEIEEKYKKASPLADYLDQKKEENIVKHTTFLNMLKQVKAEDIEKVEEEQEKLSKKIPFRVKFEGNYLWQIYYSENTDKYFMLVPTEDSDYSTFFYLLKKQLEKKRNAKIFVPIRNVAYSNKYLQKSEFEDLENYLWLFTKDWPLIYEVYDQKEELSIQIVGETEIYEKIRSPYKIKIDSKDKAQKFYKLVKAMFILQTELPHYFEFKTNIGKKGEIEFYIEDRKIEYDNIASWIQEEYKLGEQRVQQAKEQIEVNQKKLKNLKSEVEAQEIEYFAKEKQISTFLECKRSFFGKFKYYFKYSKKKNKKEEEETKNKQPEELIEEPVVKSKKATSTSKKNCTIEELVELYRDFEKFETVLKNVLLDLNSLKLKKKNMTKKIENATAFIQEIDNHKKSIFEFWRYTNKDEVASLSEGEKEEINVMKKITKVFNYEEDLEKYGKIMDKIQRKALSKEETDSVYLASTDLIEILNQVKNKTIEPRNLIISLKDMKKDAIQEKKLMEKDEFDIFGGMAQEAGKVSYIKNKKHREIPKDKYAILDINKNTKQGDYQEALEKIVENIDKALDKVSVSEDLPVYKAIIGGELEEKDFTIFNINSEKEMQEAIEQGNGLPIHFYKINLNRGANAVSFTNCIFYDNQNKTLPIGQDLSTKLLINVSKLEKSLKEKTSFKIVDFENKQDDLSDIKIKTIHVFEYDT